jgi:Protein of unknown function (DUF3485)
MSSDTATPGASIETPIPPEPTPPSHRWRASLAWAAIACVLLGASGSVRAVQDRRHQFEKAQKDPCPIDLNKVPDHFGSDWKLLKGGDRKLDPLTMRISGGTDHLIRTYANEMTGVFVTILVLYGPAEPVLPHTPQACYPATGYSAVDPPLGRSIAYSLGQDDQGRPLEGQADFLAASFAKPNGRQMLREAVYHSYRLDGQWSHSIGAGRKFPRRNPGIFKVQIQRMVADGEKLDKGDPIEQFLKLFLAEIESEIKAAQDQARPKDKEIPAKGVAVK